MFRKYYGMYNHVGWLMFGKDQNFTKEDVY